MVTRSARAIVLLLLLSGVLALTAGGAVAAGTTIKPGKSCVADAHTGCIQGKVIDDNINPVAGAGVRIVGPSGEKATSTTASDGSFFFAVDKAGAYKVSIDPSTLPQGVTLPTTGAQTFTVSLNNITPAGVRLKGHPAGSVSHGVKAVSRGELAWEQFSQGLLLGLLLALAAIGLSLIYGTTKLSNFAHSEQITLGGFLAYWLAVQLGWNIILATVVVVIAAGASGYFQDRLMWAPLRRRGLGLNQLMVVTIGLSLALEYIFATVWGTRVLPVATTLELNTGPLDITPRAYWSMLVSLVVLVGVGLVLIFTRLGRATRAVADNPALAAASGIDVDRIIRIVWTVSTAMAGLSGVLYGLVYGGIQWLTGAQLLMLVFAAVTLGGIGTAFGALVGSIIIGIVANMSTLWIPQDLKYATGMVILILILLFRPQGILGRAERVG